ncbi:craniofacial development protein 2-like [Schistocerca piceifrons]|uniref:craniofacial development protein 2-like n=1 Tax=Schistocerca piceifrons TaxID=274613 RepID=UPI001F5E9DEC|nr:craniofacial development protein 2-like [Schistocerca piceifrons]
MQNLFKEVAHLKIDIVGVSEHRWPDSACVSQEDKRMFYSGPVTRGKNGVANIVWKKFMNCETSTAAVSDRVIAIHIRNLKQNVNVVQVYAPTADKSDEEIESFYNDLHSITRTLKKEDMNLIIGDFNAEVGNARIDGVARGFGLGGTNERGMALINFCRAEEFTIKNTFY